MTELNVGQVPMNAMTCDVEDYFQVSAFEHLIDRKQWSTFECRIPRNIDKTLQMLADTGNSATFFTLGWVAENHPQVVRRIADAGHEIASHGMQHVRIWQQTPEQFFEDASAARKILEDVSGKPVTGYRAASWSLDGRTPWAHEKLAESGYTYSSSIYPISHDHYGMPDAPRVPFRVADGALLEIPASTARYFGRRLPAAGGGYFRLFPQSLSRTLIRRINEREEIPHIFYFHPWELDPDQPRVHGLSTQTRIRHYLNLSRFESRLQNVLQEFRWGRMDEIFV